MPARREEQVATGQGFFRVCNSDSSGLEDSPSLFPTHANAVNPTPQNNPAQTPHRIGFLPLRFASHPARNPVAIQSPIPISGFPMRQGTQDKATGMRTSRKYGDPRRISSSRIYVTKDRECPAWCLYICTIRPRREGAHGRPWGRDSGSASPVCPARCRPE